ncbi:MAG: T9SS type A sorting domain-containing protein, partial [Saprospiraceae bacterium]
GSDLHYLAIQPDNKNVIYTAGDIEGIFKTTDGGNTWQNVNNNLAQLPYGADIYWINEIIIDPVDYQKVFICDAVGLFVSENGGNNWQLLFPHTIDDDNNPPVETSALAIDPMNTSRLFLGLGDEAGECSFADFLPFSGYEGPWGVYRSLDGGQSWTFEFNGLPDSLSVHTIDVIPNTDIVIMATNRGVFRSDDGGDSWAPKNTGLPHTNCHRIKLSNDGGDYVLTLTLKTIGDIYNSTTFSGGIFRSDDMGESWYDITGNLPEYDPYDFLFYDYWKFDVNPGDVDNIYIATNPGSGYDETGIFATWDGGLDWELLYTPVIGGWMDPQFFWEGYAYDIRLAPSDPSRIAICRDDVEISSDAGYTWHNAFTTAAGAGWKGNGLELMNTESVAFDPFDSNKIYVGYDDFGLFRSDDAGNSFIRLDSHQDPVVGNVSDIDATKEIFVDPGNGDLYIERYQGSQGGLEEGFTSGGLLFSSNQGASVSDITGNLPKDGRYDVAIDFSSGSPGNRTIYAAIYNNGVYKSTNGGSSWNPINTGLGNKALYVWDIAISPGNSQELYLGINSWGQGDNGLFKSTNGGQSWSEISSLPAGDIGRVYVSNSQHIYVGISDDFDWSTSGGLYRSTDQGNTWNLILNHSRVVDVEVNPSNPDVIMAVGQQWYNVTPFEYHGIFISEDNGSTWSLITAQNINHTAFNFARFNPHNPMQGYAGTAGGGLWKTTLSIPAGIEEVSATENSSVCISPNPSDDAVAITLTGYHGKVNITVMNIQGQEVKKAAFPNQRAMNLDVNDLAPGLYFLHIKTLKNTFTVKLVKE